FDALPGIFTDFARQRWQPLLDRLDRINADQRDAVFLSLAGTCRLALAVGKPDDVAIAEAREAARLFAEASEAPALVPPFHYSAGVIGIRVEAAILREGGQPPDPRGCARIWSNIPKLMAEGRLRRSERAHYLPKAIDVLDPEVGRILLADWQADEPD